MKKTIIISVVAISLIATGCQKSSSEASPMVTEQVQEPIKVAPVVQVELDDPFAISPEDEAAYQRKQDERKEAEEATKAAMEANIPVIEVELSDPFAI